MLEGSEAGLKAAQLELWRHYRCQHRARGGGTGTRWLLCTR